MKTKLTLLAALLVTVLACGCRFAMPEGKMKASVHSQEDVAVTYNQNFLLSLKSGGDAGKAPVLTLPAG